MGIPLEALYILYKSKSLHTCFKIDVHLNDFVLFQFKDILKLEEDIPHVREAAKVK
jgi:hypothetical protein